MKHFKHPATIVAAFALFVALGGGAAWASGLINGSQIKNHSISAKKLTKSAVKSLHGAKGARGPAGPAGAAGATGAAGAAGNTGAQGPSGVVTTANLTSGSCAPNAGAAKFCGTTLQVTFDAKTTALVTGTIDYASTDGNQLEAFMGVCHAAHGSTSLTMDQSVEPEFQASANSYFAQTVSGVVKGLTPGSYDVGICVDDETANVEHGIHEGTVLVAETP